MKAILFIIVIIGGLFFCSDTKWSGHEEVAMVGDSYTGNGPGADRKDPSTEDEDQIKNAANYDDAHQAENNRQ